ncbi:MAG TPA: pilus assembly protein N-terminal domain-containing protein [Bryobacteraceae bacterium]|nr:pilus assembly protein N-terminal domain-containing protein [Bryobacteraceae bacterium]
MLKSVGVLAALGLASAAYAQPQEQPERLVPEASISVGVGRAEILRFRTAFGSVNVATQGIVQAIPQSDHVLTLYGEKEGVTYLTVRTDKGEEIYSATVSVTQEPGHVVKLYGKAATDYVGFYCTESGCGRADRELNGSREPSRSEQTIIHRSAPRGQD